MGGTSETISEEKEIFSSRVIKIVFLALLLDLLGFTLILPLFPSILDHYGQTEVRATDPALVLQVDPPFL